MSQKCVHKGCGKLFSDAEEPCTYHPGPPVFHEGQKGWKCCKPRVLTFDEFMTITPCTTGTHSTVDDTPAPEPALSNDDVEAKITAQEVNGQPAVSRAPIAAPPPQATPAAAAPPEDEEDDPDAVVPEGATCKRRGCGSTFTSGQKREGEQCVHHPGQALFHEGSKGWTCCKKRVMEFDEFMKLPGCQTKDKHLFVGKKKDTSTEEKLETVRSDFYQTATSVIASLYLKKIDKERSTVKFTDANSVELDLHTSDGKGYATTMATFGTIKPEGCVFKIMGTKLELTLAKGDGSGWPVLRKDDRHTGEIIQAGRAGRV